MFNLRNIVTAVITAVTAARAVIQRVAESSPLVANLIRQITHPAPTQPSATDHTQARSPAHDTTAAENRADGPSLEELRRQEMMQRAAAFDNDIARLSPQDEALDPGNAAPSSARQPFDIEIARLLQPELIPAELIVQAMGNPVAQSLLQMLRHERAHLDMLMQAAPSVEQGLVLLFAQAEEGTVETAEAARIYEQAAALSAADDVQSSSLLQMTPEQLEMLMASDAAFGIGPTHSKRGRDYKMQSSRPQNTLINAQSPQPTAEGQKYLLAVEQVSSEVADVDPVFLGMLVKNEWDNRAYEHVLPFFLTQIDDDYSYGVAQIQGATAVETIQRHPALFKSFPQIFGNDSNVNQYLVEWELFVNEEFNLRVAAAHIGDLRDDVTENLEAAGIVISDQPVEGQITMTPAQVYQLTAITWNEGPHRVAALLNDAVTSDDALESMLIKIEAYSEPGAHLSNVYSQQAYVEEQVGQELGVNK